MKILYVVTIGATMDFFRDIIAELIKEGHIVDIACNVSIAEVPSYYKELGCKVFKIDCVRNPIDKGNVKAINQIREIVVENEYDIVHCHTPIASVCARIGCRKIREKGVKVFYTAHGFHFYTGASLKYWLVFYPIEKICSKWTDVLITINAEDFKRAKKNFKAQKTYYVPGVGIDIEKYSAENVNNIEKRQELGLTPNDIMVLSVGELSKRKNHEVVIRAIHKLNNKNIRYFICGEGELKDYYGRLIVELGLEEQVRLLGYRTDIRELCQMADLFVFPSHQEGLPVALMEAIATRTPVLCSNIRGNVDLVKDNDFLFNEKKVDSLVCSLTRILEMGDREDICLSLKEYANTNYETLKAFEIGHVNKIMMKIYTE